MGRTGKDAADIFASTAPAPVDKGAPRGSAKRVGKGATKGAPVAPPAAAPRGRGRPIAHEEPTTKATVVLYNRQIAQLDRLGATVRERSGRVINRADIIRALIDAVGDASLDLSSATSEDDVRRMVAGRLKGAR